MENENDKIKIESREQAGCLLTLRIFVKPELAKKSYKAAIKEINKEISIPGFRKGKAPEKEIEKNYATYIEKEWKEILINEAFKASLELTKIYPFDKKSIRKAQLENHSLEGAVVTIAYEHAPLVPTIDFSKIKIPAIKKKKVTDDAVQEILLGIQQRRAGFEEITSRPIAEGDHVRVTLVNKVGESEHPLIVDRRLEFVEKKMPPWLFQALPKAKIAENMPVEIPADEKNPESQTMHVILTLHAVEKIMLPEINDELAQQEGFPNKEKLIEVITNNLEEDASESQKQESFAALEQALLEAYPFEIPSSLLQSEIDERMKRRLEMQRNEALDEAAIKESVKDEVEKGLRLHFLMQQIAKMGNIAVSHEELTEEVNREFTYNPQYYGIKKDNETTKRLISNIANGLYHKKVKNFALSQIST